jgi:Na+-translocating ferredoxin:NAD+ oxidoreductase RnfD subunit
VNTAPLYKTNLSNERLMSALLPVLLLYNLPRFIKNPGGIPALLLLVAIGLALDAAVNFFLYKRPVCAVPAAVTALILYSLSPGAPFWAECAALAAALIAGKAVWGGTGKNPLNPAMVGLALLAFISPYQSPAFEPTLLLLPAAVLSLPFILIRPYAGAGMVLGMSAALLARGGFAFASLMSWGVLFWGCLVITDPVTTTPKPTAGFVIGVLAGLVPMLVPNTAAALPLGILVSNILSYQADRMDLGKPERLRKTFSQRQKIVYKPETVRFIDLTETSPADTDVPDVERGVIFERRRRVPDDQKAARSRRCRVWREASHRQRRRVRPRPHPRQMAPDPPP